MSVAGSLEGRPQRDPTGGDPALRQGSRPTPNAVPSWRPWGVPGWSRPPYRPKNPFGSFPARGAAAPGPSAPPARHIIPRGPVRSRPSRKPPPFPRPCRPPRKRTGQCRAAGNDPLRPSRPLSSPPPPLPFVLRGKAAPASRPPPGHPRRRPAPPAAERGAATAPPASGDLFFIIIVIAIYYYHRHRHIILISFIFIILGGPMMRAHPHSAAHGDLVPKHLSPGAPPWAPSTGSSQPTLPVKGVGDARRKWELADAGLHPSTVWAFLGWLVCWSRWG